MTLEQSILAYALLRIITLALCIGFGSYFLVFLGVRDEAQINYLVKEKTMIRKFRKAIITVLSFAAVLLTAAVASAAEAAAPAGGESYIKVIFAVGAMVGAGIAIGGGAIGAGAGIGSAASGACQAVGRNPGVQGKVMMTMLVGMAMAESIAIYALVVSLVLLYANPYAKLFIGG
ncbi:MAG: ATP synthase subunit c, sodium ion specific [Syntrophus sp. PtaB.Bin001]|nr:MAG: ATP synthase subunit c, sodium ion specific [Syntrophus sp. PtaB.Bin001]